MLPEAMADDRVVLVCIECQTRVAKSVCGMCLCALYCSERCRVSNMAVHARVCGYASRAVSAVRFGLVATRVVEEYVATLFVARTVAKTALQRVMHVVPDTLAIERCAVLYGDKIGVARVPRADMLIIGTELMDDGSSDVAIGAGLGGHDETLSLAKQGASSDPWRLVLPVEKYVDDLQLLRARGDDKMVTVYAGETATYGKDSSAKEWREMFARRREADVARSREAMAQIREIFQRVFKRAKDKVSEVAPGVKYGRRELLFELLNRRYVLKFDKPLTIIPEPVAKYLFGVLKKVMPSDKWLTAQHDHKKSIETRVHATALAIAHKNEGDQNDPTTYLRVASARLSGEHFGVNEAILDAKSSDATINVWKWFAGGTLASRGVWNGEKRWSNRGFISAALHANNVAQSVAASKFVGILVQIIIPANTPCLLVGTDAGSRVLLAHRSVFEIVMMTEQLYCLDRGESSEPVAETVPLLVLCLLGVDTEPLGPSGSTVQQSASDRQARSPDLALVSIPFSAPATGTATAPSSPRPDGHIGADISGRMSLPPYAPAGEQYLLKDAVKGFDSTLITGRGKQPSSIVEAMCVARCSGSPLDLYVASGRKFGLLRAMSNADLASGVPIHLHTLPKGHRFLQIEEDATAGGASSTPFVYGIACDETTGTTPDSSYTYLWRYNPAAETSEVIEIDYICRELMSVGMAATHLGLFVWANHNEESMVHHIRPDSQQTVRIATYFGTTIEHISAHANNITIVVAWSAIPSAISTSRGQIRDKVSTKSSTSGREELLGKLVTRIQAFVTPHITYHTGNSGHIYGCSSVEGFLRISSLTDQRDVYVSTISPTSKNIKQFGRAAILHDGISFVVPAMFSVDNMVLLKITLPR